LNQVRNQSVARNKQPVFFPALFWFLVSTLKIEETCFSETPLTFSGIHGVISQKLNFSKRKILSRHVARKGDKKLLNYFKRKPSRNEITLETYAYMGGMNLRKTTTNTRPVFSLLRITSNDMSFKYDNEPSNSVKGGIS
jgi:hypothetical protein